MKTSAALAAALGLAALTASAVPALAQPARPNQCFRLSQMRGWKAEPDGRGIYYRVGLRDVWEARFSSACPMIRYPNAHLVNKVSNDLICSPIEFDLRVSDNTPGFPATPCIVESYRMLSPEEAAALPPKLRP